MLVFACFQKQFAVNLKRMKLVLRIHDPQHVPLNVKADQLLNYQVYIVPRFLSSTARTSTPRGRMA